MNSVALGVSWKRTRLCAALLAMVLTLVRGLRIECVVLGEGRNDRVTPPK